ncbi:copal-8-ol diphosphate hydratase, chloroplastic-like, partial [Olea europaea subsp. europaea]
RQTVLTSIYDFLKVSMMKGLVDHIRVMLDTMGDGRTSVAPNDTAWIALIRNLHGIDLPKFPSSLQWIGDVHFFLAYDRLLNTLACVFALRSWNIWIKFTKKNIHKLESAEEENMTCGFEIVFFALLQRPRNLGIDDIPYDTPIVKEIYDARDRKLKRQWNEVPYVIVLHGLYLFIHGIEPLLRVRTFHGLTKVDRIIFHHSNVNFMFLEKYDVIIQNHTSPLS